MRRDALGSPRSRGRGCSRLRSRRSTGGDFRPRASTPSWARLERWLGLLRQPAGDPLTALRRVLDERFRRVVNTTFELWRDGFTQALERGQAEGTVRRDVDARKVAAFIVAARSAAMLRSNLELLGVFLDNLRPAPRKRRRAIEPTRNQDGRSSKAG